MEASTKETKQDKILLSASSESIKDKQQLILEIVRRWGSSNSDAVLDPRCKIFSIPTIDGIMGYRYALGCAIVFGDPICAPSDLPQLAQAFHHYCQENNWNTIYIIASETFAHWALKHICKALIEFGEELTFDPHDDPREGTGVNASLVRRKVKHALHEGTKVKEYLPYNAQLEESIEQIGKAWLKNRRGPQIHISPIRLFADRLGKRWLYAQQGECLVGVVVLNQLQSHQGWLLNHLMITPDAPHGTPELLIISALEILARENCSYLTCGAVIADQIGEIYGLGKISTWLTYQGFNLIDKLFHLGGRRKFWEKFHPHVEHSYLLLSQPTIGLREILAIIRVLNVM